GIAFKVFEGVFYLYITPKYGTVGFAVEISFVGKQYSVGIFEPIIIQKVANLGSEFIIYFIPKKCGTVRCNDNPAPKLAKIGVGEIDERIGPYRLFLGVNFDISKSFNDIFISEFIGAVGIHVHFF